LIISLSIGLVLLGCIIASYVVYRRRKFYYQPLSSEPTTIEDIVAKLGMSDQIGVGAFGK
jgi:hypothetical protein